MKHLPHSISGAGRAVRRRQRRLLLGAPTLLAAAMSLAETPEHSEPLSWRSVERVVAIGDLHGHYEEMLGLLETTGLIDVQLRWAGGAAHLVLLGDLIDRGPADRAVLELARGLQPQALEAGGRVHVLLGNHEVMNLSQNFKYVTPESFAEFAEEETAQERQEGQRAFRQSLVTRGLSSAQFQAAFDERFPPGYFARRRALAPDGTFGAWLLEQPTAVQINGRVYVHGGLTPETAELGLGEINRRTRAGILAFYEQARSLESVSDWPHSYREVVRSARRISREQGRRASKRAGGTSEAAWSLLATLDALPFSTDSPVWYRGSAVENERIEERRINRVLALLDAKGLVVAHTPTRSGEITSRFNGRLLRTDVGMGYEREGRALVLEEGAKQTVVSAQSTAARVLAEAPQGEGWPQGQDELPDDVLERFLARAKIQSITPADFGIPVELLELEGDGMSQRAIFGYSQETAEQALAAGRRVPRRYQNTIAAYRLDRLMNLGRVPVSVPRRVKGRRGLVQIWLQSAWDQELIEEYDAWSLLEGLETEVAEASAFSALIGTVEQVPAGRMLIPETKRIVLADNSVSFSLDESFEVFLPEGCGPVGASFLASLRALERGQLLELLEGLVAPAAVKALLARRSELVERCERPAPGWSIDAIRKRITATNAELDAAAQP